MKKLLSILLAACLLVSMTACSGGNDSSKADSSKADSSKAESSQAASAGGDSTADSVADKYAETLKLGALYEISKDRVPTRPSLIDEKVKEMFNVELEWNDIQSSAYNDIINTLLAGDEYPEIFWNLNHEQSVKNMGLEGYLKPLEDYLDQMPNYTALWSAEDFETVLAFCKASDGHLYYTPNQNYRTASMAWVYRKTAFDEMGLQFPETIDDLYTVLKTIKEKDPESFPMPANRGGWGNVLNGLRTAYGVGSKASYVDAYTGEFIPYGYTQDGFREAVKWGAKFYAESLIDPEFATGTDAQWTETYATGKAYIEYSYGTRASWAEVQMKAIEPDVDWEWSKINVTADKSKGFVYDREDVFYAYGYSFTDKISEDGLERMLQWCDYISSEEGQIFMNMGVEGVTYQKNADGTLQFMDHMYHETRNPEGTQPWVYGLYMGTLAQNPDYVREVGKEVDLELSDAFESNANAHYYPKYPTAYTAEEENRLATLDTQINDMADEYILKFIMGQMDPNDDAQWQAYLDALDNAGLQEAAQIRLNSWEKVSK